MIEVPDYIQDMIEHPSHKVRRIARVLVQNVQDEEHNMLLSRCVQDLPQSLIEHHSATELIAIVQYGVACALNERFKGVSW